MMGIASNYAGFGQRFVSLLIDVIVLIIVQVVLMVVLGVLGEAGATMAQGLGMLVGIGYQAYFFTKTGQTPGMKIMNIKLVNGSGEIVSIGQALVRIVVAYISGLVLAIGYLWMIWDANKQTWHDKAAGTFIVRV